VYIYRQVQRGKKPPNQETTTNPPPCTPEKEEINPLPQGHRAASGRKSTHKHGWIYISVSGLWLVWRCLTARLPRISNCSLHNYEKKFQRVSALKSSEKL